MKSIVVYFTRTGNTKVVANTISEKLGCDIEEIVDNKKRTGFIGTTGAYFTPINKKTTIKNIKAHLSDYDMVLLGSPIWWYTMAPAASEFIKKYKDQINNLALFYTCGVDKKIRAVSDLEELYGKPPNSTLVVESRNVKEKTFEGKIDTFIKNSK
ncbi:MAG: hypothetical protein KAJ51_07485 [Thermoplasmata archaeon]|nr:hypothetical protein [Thermoplasmata archaeon]